MRAASLKLDTSLLMVALILASIVWPAQLALNNPWQWTILVGPVMFGAAAAILVMAGATRFRMPQWLVLFTLLWLTAAGASAILVGDPRVLQVYGALLLVFYLVAALAAASPDRLRLVRFLIMGVVVGGIALMAISLVMEPFSLRRYQGVLIIRIVWVGSPRGCCILSWVRCMETGWGFRDMGE